MCGRVRALFWPAGCSPAMRVRARPRRWISPDWQCRRVCERRRSQTNCARLPPCLPDVGSFRRMPLPVEASGVSSSHMNEQANWRRAFEMIGPDTLRLRLEMRRGEYSGEYGRAAEKWLLEKKAEADRADAERFNTIRSWTITAAIAGAVAASRRSLTVPPTVVIRVCFTPRFAHRDPQPVASFRAPMSIETGLND